MRNKVNNTQGSAGSSSALIIIITLALITAAAFVLGGSQSFSKKYAGLSAPSERSFKSTLAQIGVIGKNLEFEGSLSEGFRARLSSIDLDGEVLGANQKFVATIVPPLEGDNPFWYRTTVGDRSVAQGYPLRQDFSQNLASTGATLSTLPNSAQPLLPGMTVCSSNGGTPQGGSALYVFFEDVAYETGIGFDDPVHGQVRRSTVCGAVSEFEEILRLDETVLAVDPVIVVQASDANVPESALSVVSPQYVGGSGFVSTLLADLLRTGQRRSTTDLSGTVSVLGSNAGFMRFGFDNGSVWLEEGNAQGYSMATVTRQNMLRLLGFGSFVGHEQENVLNSSWKRWSEWDRLLFNQSNPTIDLVDLNFIDIDLNNIDLNQTSANNYHPIVRGENGGVGIYGASLPDALSLFSFAFDEKPVFTLSNWQKGQSLSGLSNPDAVSYPMLSAGQNKFVTEEERQILCMLGLAVDGVSGCEKPRSVVRDRYIEHQSNKSVCINLFDNVSNAYTDGLELSGPVQEVADDDFDMNNSFVMYTQPCEVSVFETPQEKAEFDAQYATTSFSQAKSFAWVPKSLLEEGGDMNNINLREFVQFQYSVKDTVTGRVSDPGVVSIHKCVILPQGEQLCNGDFQFSGARSPIDFQLPSFRLIGEDDGDILTSEEGDVWGGEPGEFFTRPVHNADGLSNPDFSFPFHPNCTFSTDSQGGRTYFCGVPLSTIIPLEGFANCDLISQNAGTQVLSLSYYCPFPGGDGSASTGRSDTPPTQPFTSNQAGSNVSADFIECRSNTTPGWCAQGSPSVYSSLYGYTWHPYLVESPSAFDAELASISPRKFAGVSSDVIAQRLRAPLQSTFTYEVSGKVYITNPGTRPTFWYANQNALALQADGSFHIEYPTQMMGINEPVANRMELFAGNIPSVSGWHDFSITFSPGDIDVTHIGFGSTGVGSSVYFDDLSLQYSSGCTNCSADLNGDCVVNSSDLSIFLSSFGLPCPEGTVGCNGDFNFDGVVNSSDLSVFLSSFGMACPVFEDLEEGNNLSLDMFDPNGRVSRLVAQVSQSARNLFGDTTDQTRRGFTFDEDQKKLVAPVRESSVISAFDERDREIAREDEEKTEGVRGSVETKGRFPVQKAVVALSENVTFIEDNDLNVFFKLLDRPQVVRNSRGFSANFVVWTQNNRSDALRGLELIGLVPSYIEYRNHVSTRNDTSYQRATNSLRLQNLPPNQEVEVYFDVKLDDSLCAQVLRENRQGYRVLADMSLCVSEEVLEEQRKQFLEANQRRSSRLRTGSGVVENEDGIIPNPGGDGDDGKGDECVPDPRDPGACDEAPAPGQCTFIAGDGSQTVGDCPAGVPSGYFCTPSRDDPAKWDCVAEEPRG